MKIKLKNIKFFFRLFVPDKNKILIFDEEGSEDLVQYVSVSYTDLTLPTTEAV